jgi:hypothetical protein
MTKKPLFWTVALARILTLLITPALGPAPQAAPSAPERAQAGVAEPGEPDWVQRTPETAPPGAF